MGFMPGPRRSVWGAPHQKALILTAWLGVWILLTSGQGSRAEAITARVGETATLNASVTTGVFSFNWYRGTAVNDETLKIFSYIPSSDLLTPGDQYTGRETALKNGSLHITGLRTSDSGNYTASATLAATGSIVVGTPQQLRVYELVPKPSVTSEPLQLVENQGPAVITCNASTAATTILWSFNSSPNLPANILPSSNNRTLRIANVSLEDSGIYQCVAMNPVSINASEPRNLTVAFGPEGVKINPAGPVSVQNGTRLSLSCTARSFPAPRYQWSLNGTELMSTNGTVNVSSQDNGTYTCVAYNNVTGLTAKASVSIVVLEFFPTVAPKPEVLSGGAIAGIVIAALVVVAGVAALVYFFVFKKPASGAAAGGNTTEMTPKINEASANGTAAEIQYSSVNFVPKRGTTEKPIAPENTVYSEVRR